MGIGDWAQSPIPINLFYLNLSDLINLFKNRINAQ